MKKAIVLISIIILLIPLNIYGASDIDYYNAHIKEIKEYNPGFNIGHSKRLIRLNSKLKTVDMLKKLYGSIDEYSTFYSREELGISLFDKVDLVEKSVEYEIKDGVGYIIIPSFYKGVYDDLLLALEYIDENQITNIVLDLRDNPGGDISESIKIAQLFVKEGLIAKIDYYSEELDDEEYYSNLKELKYKLLVKVNRDTASAAELLAGAIKESNSGIIIGGKTFGKSQIQKLIPIISKERYIHDKKIEDLSINLMKNLQRNIYFNDRDILGWAKLSIGRFLDINGVDIQGKGLIPDY